MKTTNEKIAKSIYEIIKADENEKKYLLLTNEYFGEYYLQTETDNEKKYFKMELFYILSTDILLLNDNERTKRRRFKTYLRYAREDIKNYIDNNL